MIMLRSTSALIGLVAVGSILASCGQSDADPAATSSEGAGPTTATEADTSLPAVDEPAVGETVSAPPDGLAACDGCDPADIDPGWVMSSRPWFAYDVAADAPVPVFVEPSFGAEVVAELSAEARGLPAFEAGTDGWMPIAVGAGAGWVPEQFLRPEPEVANAAIVGTPPAGVEEAAEQFVAALPDGPVLSSLVGAEGLMISLDATITENDVTVSASELADPTAEVRDWGPGSSGGAVNLTLDEILFDMSGSAALTSTERIGFDDAVDSAAADELRAAFPDAVMVEYHFAGTESADREDWATVTVVIDSASGEPIPIAIISSAGPGATQE